jgi:ubiquinone/menaquinone biosynthesis C-methylase UbiE
MPAGHEPAGHDVDARRPEDEVYTIAADEETARREHERLRVLARWRDPSTKRALQATGIGPGWRCLEVGAGAGTITAWMADVVGAEGSVLSTDVDLRFHGDAAPNVEVRQHDITADALEEGSFDLVHARAVLQHVAERERALERMIAALKPGGWVVVEEADMRAFEAQPLPEPLGALHRLMVQAAQHQEYREANFGTRCLRLFQDHELDDVSAEGLVETMRASEDSAEWWFLAVEHVRDRIVDAGVFTGEDFDAALAIARTPGFLMLGPTSIQVVGRRP